MKLTEPDVKKYKKTLIILGAAIVICLIFPAIIGVGLLYIGTIPAAILCGFLIYKFAYDYREQSDAKKLYDCITVKGICRVDKISKELGWNNAKTRDVLTFCLKNEYLEDYYRVGEEIRKKAEDEDVDVSKVSAKKSARKCPHCGGVAEYYEGEKVTCIYCGNVIESE